MNALTDLHALLKRGRDPDIIDFETIKAVRARTVPGDGLVSPRTSEDAMTDTPRTVSLARTVERREVQRRIMLDAVVAVMEDRVLDAANHIDALDRPYLEALTKKAITVLELARERAEELEREHPA